MRGMFLMAVLLISGPTFGFEAAAPADFRFGEGVEAHQALFDSACVAAELRELDPAENPAAQETLVQVDCNGFHFHGGARLAEFVFADGRLTHVWILTTPGDETDLREAFEAAFGAPSHDTPGFVAFTQANAAIRRDVPEVLYYGGHVAPLFAAWFDSASAEQEAQGPE